MAIPLDDYKIAYHPIPKVACTSLKHICYEVLHGEPFKKNNPSKNLHQQPGFNSRPPSNEEWRKISSYTNVVVIRDPVKRALSAYSNRVLYHRELTLGAIGKLEENNPLYWRDENTWHAFGALALLQLDIKANPNPDFFFQNLHKYRRISRSIRNHTKLQKEFINRDLSNYTVIKIEELDRFRELLKEATGKAIEIPHMQTAGPRIEFDALEKQSKRLLLRYCREDYDFLSDHYKPPKLGAVGATDML